MSQYPSQGQQYPSDQPPWQGQPSQPLPPQSPGQWQQPNTGYQSAPQYSGQWQQPIQPGMYPPQQQPMQPGMYPPQQPPKKKSRLGLWIALGVIVVLLLACGGIAAAVNSGAKSVQSTINTTLTTVATAAHTTGSTSSSQGQGTFTTTHTFTGNGTKKTETFTVGNDWKIIYSCNGMIASVATDGILGVSVYGSDGSIVDPAAINATCKSGSALTKGETEEHQGGQVYLDINGTGDWTVTVQELK